MTSKATTLTAAEHIAALLAHPDTPVIVHNDLAAWLADAAAPVIATFDKSPGFIQQVLDHHAEIDRGVAAATERGDEGRNSPAELAEHLSAVLTHPATPAELYNAIANEVSTWSSAYCSAVSETVPYIESCLLYHQREQHERTEGGHADD